MEKEFMEIIKDYIQDTRINTGMKMKYELLVDALIETTRLNYSKDDLRLGDDTAIIMLLKAFEPKKYNKKFSELFEAEIETHKEEIPF